MIDQAPGGFVSLRNNPDDSPSLPQNELTLRFSNIASLNVTTGRGSDTITVHKAAKTGMYGGQSDKEIPVEFNTGDGKDSLTLNDSAVSGPNAIRTLANLGGDSDAVVVRTQGTNSLINVDSGDGEDDISIEAAAANTIVDVSTGRADDVNDAIRISGQGLAPGSDVRLALGREEQDALRFNSERDAATQSDWNVAVTANYIRVEDAAGNAFGAVTKIDLFENDGSVTAKALGEVEIENVGGELLATSAVAKQGATIAQGMNQVRITEGDSITLAGYTNFAPQDCEFGCTRNRIVYAWDLNGDGRFTELVTSNSQVELAWQDLVDYGFDDGPVEDANGVMVRKRDVPLRISYISESLDSEGRVVPRNTAIRQNDTS
ncbi:MAG: hypothetical protein KDA47_25395, partial [Planctomycetales bacterium]|nr:hypothetical protein [Planctomycetales bacterium]